jgi:hypothetical protein
VETHAGAGDRVQIAGGTHQIQPAVSTISEKLGDIGDVLEISAIKEIG